VALSVHVECGGGGAAFVFLTAWQKKEFVGARDSPRLKKV
jgi:hypothetical protein